MVCDMKMTKHSSLYKFFCLPSRCFTTAFGRLCRDKLMNYSKMEISDIMDLIVTTNDAYGALPTQLKERNKEVYESMMQVLTDTVAEKEE